MESTFFHQIISHGRSNYRQNPAILAPGKKALSYQGLSQHLLSTTRQLTQQGIRSGDRLALVLPNGPELATAFLAVSSVCTCAPLNPNYQVREFKESFENLHVKALVISADIEHKAREAANSLGVPIIDLNIDPNIAGVFSVSGHLPEDKTIKDPIYADIEDVALVLQTSGTTSKPKTVPITHKNISYSLNNIINTYKLSSADRCLNLMPLFHVHGLMAALLSSLICGASVVCSPGIIPDHVLGWFLEYQPTWYTAVPTIHQVILEQIYTHPEFKRPEKLRFIRSCSSALPPKIAQDLENAFGVPVLEAYGMTEGTHQIASNPLPPDVHKFGSVGPATGTTEIAILDNHGAILPSQSVGEICIQGENVMGGYENNPIANTNSFIDGWLRTGDLGYLDNDGYLFIKGRSKEFINRGGEKISPREIDEVLINHPAVKQAVAFSIPHPSLGEDIAAAVVLREGYLVSSQKLRRFAATHLADFKVPRLIVIVNQIPKGPTGKIQRIGLSERLKTELEEAKFEMAPGGSKPRNPLEADILSIWQEVLEEQSIGVHDDFLALGGESIQAARILLHINEQFGLNLQLKDLFDTPTIALLAERIQKR